MPLKSCRRFQAGAEGGKACNVLFQRLEAFVSHQGKRLLSQPDTEVAGVWQIE